MLLKLLKRHFKKTKGFTLAEVLITLGIIGVVAALTLPTLIQNHKKQTYVNQLKKVVNTLENAAQMAVAQEGVSSFKDTKLYKLRMNNTYSCFDGDSNICNEYINEFKKYFKFVKYDTTGESYFYKHINDATPRPLQAVSLYLEDGSIIFYGYDFGFVDINGNKGPNILGRDVFKILLSNKGSIEEYSVSSGVCNPVTESQYLEKGCYYSKIVSDGWKMNY